MYKRIKEYLINVIQDYVKDKEAYPYKYIIDVDKKDVKLKEKVILQDTLDDNHNN